MDPPLKIRNDFDLITQCSVLYKCSTSERKKERKEKKKEGKIKQPSKINKERLKKKRQK